MSDMHALSLTTPSDREIRLTRVFDAPRRLVFDAMTQPQYIRHWYGLRGTSMTVCEVDFCVGGEWRYVIAGMNPDGSDVGMRGIYLEITAPEGFVSTEAFDGFPGAAVATVRLEEREGKTTFTNTLKYASTEMRDIVLKGGMESGASETFDRLAEMLATL
jgi:uncharacterized protein YndB with AHSA1/START domain